MIRFILNFIFFGIIFFLIWKFQPDWIDAMRSWAEQIYNVIVDVGSQLVDRIKDSSNRNAE